VFLVLNFFLGALFDLTRVVFLACLLTDAFAFVLTLATGVDDATSALELAVGTLDCLASGTGDGRGAGTGAAA
jgi:hypothetical protein